MACPTQFLSMTTTAKTNESVIRNFSDASLELLNGAETSVIISTSELPAGVKYYSNFSIKDLNGGVVDIGETSLWFSESDRIIIKIFLYYAIFQVPTVSRMLPFHNFRVPTL